MEIIKESVNPVWNEEKQCFIFKNLKVIDVIYNDIVGGQTIVVDKTFDAYDRLYIGFAPVFVGDTVCIFKQPWGATDYTYGVCSIKHNNDIMLKHNKIVDELIANGWKRTDGLVINDVIAEDKDDDALIILKLDQCINRYIRNKITGEYVLDVSDTIYTTNFALLSVAHSYGISIRNNIDSLVSLFKGAKIDIVQKEVKAGEEYVIPFASRHIVTKFTHDVIIDYIVNVQEFNPEQHIRHNCE